MTPEQKIAKGLTKAQRETVLDNQRCVANYPPAKKLVELGIWTGEGDEYAIYPVLTETGLAVRAILEEARND